MLPFEKVRIVDFTHMIAGPFGTMLLADYGAEVIKIETERRPDMMRRTGPWPPEINNGPVSPTFVEFNRNKLGITVDMSTAQGRDLIRRLIKISDVVVENFSAGVLGRWGLDYPRLREIKPDIVLVNLQGLGQWGPYRDWVTFGPSLMPYVGLTYAWGHPDAQEPVGSQVAHPDYIVSTKGAIAILAALWYRQRTGKGQHVDLSQAEATACLLGPLFMDYFVNGRGQPPQGNRSPSYAPYNTYRCRGEDRWCVIAVTSEEEWQRLCAVLGNPTWTRDPKYATLASRVAHATDIDQNLEEWTRHYTPHQVIRILQRAGVPAGAVQDGEDLFHDPQLRERGYFYTERYPDIGEVTYPGIIARFSRTQATLRRPAPLLGEHNRYIFGELLGLPEEEIGTLEREGVLR